MIEEDLYSRRFNLIIGFHGCDESVAKKIVLGEDSLFISSHDYEWLGKGVYFWENNQARAMEWAIECSKNPRYNIKKPAVLGAILDLGFCLDLNSSEYLIELKEGYEYLKRQCELSENPLPENKRAQNSTDILVRRLDYAVIESLHELSKENKLRPYDSVLGSFVEGKEVYDGASFHDKNHTQICVRNPNCIKGFFLPRAKDDNYENP
jgi:hypothetical protein